MTGEPPRPLDLLLAQSDWVTALARALIRDAQVADDVVQATWLDVVRNPPERVHDPRGWLATVLRRQWQRLRRGDARRERHERNAADARPQPAATSPDESTARLLLHRELTEAVLALDEPYRTTVVLRFFEHLDTEAIARRMQCPATTARSRLQRALQQLRERLDRAEGGRDRWLGPVAALAAQPLGTAGDAGAAGATVNAVFAMTMSKKILTALCAAALAVSAWWLLRDPQQPAATPTPGGATLAASAGSPDRPGRDAAAAPTTERVAAAPVTTPAPVQPSPTAPRDDTRRVVDRGGRPLAGVVMRARSRFAVAWQGGDRGWIRGPEGSMQITAADEARLRSDAGFAQEFFARSAHPDEWRATVLGQPLPARETASDDDGAFAFSPELEAAGVDDADVIVGDPRFVLVRAGRRGGAAWCVGPATRVTGVVRDELGAAIDASFVTALLPDDGGVEFAESAAMRSDANGAFLIRRALAGGVLQVRQSGFTTAHVRLDTRPEQYVEVTLRRPDPTQRRLVAGTVVDDASRPVAGADVWFGRQRTESGSDGRFELPGDGAEPEHALTVVAEGFALLQRDRLGAQVLDDAAAARDLLLVLERTPRTLRGLVLGGDGLPHAGAMVGIVDPTLLDITFSPVEARVGGWQGGVATDSEGRFALPGLAERSYRIAALDPRTGARVDATWTPGIDDELVLRLPADVRRDVTGRVYRDGSPLRDADVAVGFCTHVTRGGGTMWDSTPAVACDASGSFVLPALPPRNAWLVVRSGGAIVTVTPVEQCGAAPLDVAVSNARWLQLVGSAHPRPRQITLLRDDGTVRTTGIRLATDGSAPPIALQAGDTAVIVDAGQPGEQRLPLTDDWAVHLRVR
ncbi:MAG: sigma-70 family RNA polymerase sigma factor [Planctomycetes bacterium]|nr:sigma-70 family RNA polymerase sigma factor [Planctomycetota bacterium]